MKIVFFQVEPWQIDYIKSGLQAVSGIELVFLEGKLDKDSLTGEIMTQAKDADIVSVFVGSKIDEDVLAHFSNLKMIATRSTGFDHINVALLAQKGIASAYVPGYGDNTVAEFAFGLLLSLSRKIFEGYDRIKETGKFSFEGLRGFDLAGKTMGVVGTGRIGQHTIRIAKGFGMNVIAYDLFPKEDLAKEFGFAYVSFDDLLAQSDVISLHAPYINNQQPITNNQQQGENKIQSTHHLINIENISKIKKGAILINTARGPIVETEALVKALKEGILGGAGLDVLEEEGFIQDEETIMLYGHPEEHNLKTVLQNHVLIDMPNVIITPHNAFNTTEALQRILNTDMENIKEFVEKGEVKYKIPTA